MFPSVPTQSHVIWSKDIKWLFLTDSITSSPVPHYRRHSLFSLSSIRMAKVSQIRQNYHEECEALVNKHINLELHTSYVFLSMVRKEQEELTFIHIKHSSIEEQEKWRNEQFYILIIPVFLLHTGWSSIARICCFLQNCFPERTYKCGNITRLTEDSWKPIGFD